jgi:hypothetical protein
METDAKVDDQSVELIDPSESADDAASEQENQETSTTAGSGGKKTVGEDNCLEIRDDRIDVTALMQRIRKNMETKRAAGLLRDEPWLSQRLDMARMSDSAREHADQLALLRMTSRLELQGEPIRSHRPLLGPVINGLKRVTRFWVRKYTDPLFLRQSHYNAEVLALLEHVMRENESLRHQMEVLENKLGGSDSQQPNADDAA